MSLCRGSHSIWSAVAKAEGRTVRRYPRLTSDTASTFGGSSPDVIVIGAGILGLCTAARLVECGKNVVVLEAGNVGGGVTAMSSNKVSALQRTILSEIADTRNFAAAAAHASMNQHGVNEIARWADQLNIDCDLRRAAHCVYAETAEEVHKLRKEAGLAHKAGLAVRFVNVKAETSPADDSLGDGVADGDTARCAPPASDAAALSAAGRREEAESAHLRAFAVPCLAYVEDSGSLYFDSTRFLTGLAHSLSAPQRDEAAGGSGATTAGREPPPSARPKVGPGKCSVFEGSRVVDVSLTAPYAVTVEGGATVKATAVVVATHAPLLDRSQHFAMMKMMRSYCVAYRVTGPGGSAKPEECPGIPRSMWISASRSPTLSVRSAYDGHVLVVSGAGYEVGEEEYDTDERLDTLRGIAREWWPVADDRHGERHRAGSGGDGVDHTKSEQEMEGSRRKAAPAGRGSPSELGAAALKREATYELHELCAWGAHDYASHDKTPYIGKMMRGQPGMYIGIGFTKWGLSGGAASASILADAICRDQGAANGAPPPPAWSGPVVGRKTIETNRPHWAAVFDAARWDLMPKAAKEVAAAQAHVAKHLTKDWVHALLGRPDVKDIEDLTASCGAIAKLKGKPVGAYKTRAGETYAVSLVCTHLGCAVGFNAALRTWDCPCHGSRFDVTGAVIHGPAVRPLTRYDPRTGEELPQEPSVRGMGAGEGGLPAEACDAPVDADAAPLEKEVKAIMAAAGVRQAS
eukprot:TRINITY_DN1423_c0_g2_i2.p1 TRINITY_DN1423_c0_g2~~TRINITY_DN1423_c0_g2_i2.p1  ORF type:complete len:795 (-),score=145.44 TRINITY_DN1423_c0_g2_i2:474-2714(-)